MIDIQIEGGELVEEETIHQKAQKNLQEWLEVYGALENILQNCTEKEFEEAIQIAIQQGNVRDENKLREEFLSIRNRTRE